MVELTDCQQRELREDTDSVEAWCLTLIACFKELNVMSGLTKLRNEKYMVQDARNQRELAEYVQAIARYAKKANITDVYTKLAFTYMGIASKLCVFVEKLRSNTIIAIFIELLDLTKKAWFDLHSFVLSLLAGQSRRQPMTTQLVTMLFQQQIQPYRQQPGAFKSVQQMQLFTNFR